MHSLVRAPSPRPVTNPVTCVDDKKCLEKNDFLSFQQSIFNLRCSRAYSKSQVLQVVWRKAFLPYMFNTKVIDNI